MHFKEEAEGIFVDKTNSFPVKNFLSMRVCVFSSRSSMSFFTDHPTSSSFPDVIMF